MALQGLIGQFYSVRVEPYRGVVAIRSPRLCSLLQGYEEKKSAVVFESSDQAGLLFRIVPQPETF
eukprot:168201-Prorocentrum_minimum.AAC.1